jgi:peptide/nickel transport system substrate-binding protein
MTTIRRRTLLALAAIAASALAQPMLPLPAQAQEAKAAQGGTMTWAFLRRPQSLDPNIWSGGSDLAVMRQMYDTLIWSPKPGEFEPGLATSWEVSADGLTYTFKLRDDVTFHDGTKFDAEAVKFMFERIKDPASKSLNIGAIGPFESATVIDPLTVQVKLSRPWGAFLTNVSEPHLSPVSPAAVKQMGDGVAQNPVGTGPFKFEKWEGNDIHMVRNPDYKWGPASMGSPGPANLDKLIVKEVPEASTRTNALRSGEVDMIHFPVMSEIDPLKAAGFQVFKMPQPGFSWSFPINITKAPTDDLRVRQAMLHAINKDQIVRTVMFNQVRPAYGPLTAVTFGYDPSIESMSGYDLKKAGELLDAAGWTLAPGEKVRKKDGQPLAISMAMFESSVNKSVSEFAQAMLQQAGFDVTLNVQNYPAFATQVANADYHTAQMRWSAVDPDQVIPTMFGSNQVTGGGQFNRTRIADPALDALIAEAGATTDTARRAELYAQIQKQAMENVWLIPIYDDVWFFLTRPEVKNFRADLQGRPILYVASMAK